MRCANLSPVLVLALFAAIVSPARGAEAPAGEQAIREAEEEDAIARHARQLAHNWPLHMAVALAVTSLAIVVGLGATMRRKHLMPPRLVKELEALIDRGEYELAIDLCETTSGCLCRVVRAGLLKMSEGLDSMLAASRAAREKEAKVLGRRDRWFLVIGALTLSAGLVAALVGLVRSIVVAASTGWLFRPADFVDGILASLPPFAAAAPVALLAILAYVFFRVRVVELASEIEAAATGLLTRIRPKGRRRLK